MTTIVIDLDGTLTIQESGKSYPDLIPNYLVVNRLQEYKDLGFTIVIYTARGMRSHEKSVGRINSMVLPSIIEWLNKYEIPFDEIHVGKPWSGFKGFYVDDRAIRPSEFVNNNFDQITSLLSKESEL